MQDEDLNVDDEAVAFYTVNTTDRGNEKKGFLGSIRSIF